MRLNECRIFAMLDKMRPLILLGLIACAACGSTGEPSFERQERMQGLWRNGFEESVFCPAPAQKCDYVMTGDRAEPLIWLDASISFPAEIKMRQLGGLYEIEFLGRRSVKPGRYGHMGMFDQQVIVDRLISVREVEPPPKE
jgi:hypothetical protein